MLGWQEEVCMERGQRSRERSSWSLAHLVAVSRSWLAASPSPGESWWDDCRSSCVLTTQEWNLPFPSPEPSKEGGKVLVSPSHEAKCCCLEQFVPLKCPSSWSGSLCCPEDHGGAMEEGHAQCPTHSEALPLLRLGRRGSQESMPGSHRSPCPSLWVSSHTLSLPRPPSSIRVMI